MSGGSGRILKRGAVEAAPSGLSGVEGSLQAAQARAQKIIAEAEAQAATVLASAEEAATRARSAAAAEGHADGLAQAAASMAMAAGVREARLAELDTAVVEVALEIARRVVGRELTTSPQTVLDVARRALRAAAGTGDVVLRVSPQDLETVRQGAGALRTLVEQGALALSEDPALQRGEVIVEASGGRVDARISAQLEAFRRALRAEEH